MYIYNICTYVFLSDHRYIIWGVLTHVSDAWHACSSRFVGKSFDLQIRGKFFGACHICHDFVSTISLHTKYFNKLGKVHHTMQVRYIFLRFLASVKHE